MSVICKANTAQDVIDSQKCLAQHHLPKVHGDSVKTRVTLEALQNNFIT